MLTSFFKDVRTCSSLNVVKKKSFNVGPASVITRMSFIMLSF